jgi:hypothetical protein
LFYSVAGIRARVGDLLIVHQNTRYTNTKEAGCGERNFLISSSRRRGFSRASVRMYMRTHEIHTAAWMSILRTGPHQDNGQMMRELMGNMCTRCALGTANCLLSAGECSPLCLSRNLQQPHTHTESPRALNAPPTRPLRHLTFSRERETSRIRDNDGHMRIAARPAFHYAASAIQTSKIYMEGEKISNAAARAYPNRAARKLFSICAASSLFPCDNARPPPTLCSIECISILFDDCRFAGESRGPTKGEGVKIYNCSVFVSSLQVLEHYLIT